MGPSAKAIFSVSLTNEMQHSNGKLDYRIECKFSPFDKSTESIDVGPFYNGDIFLSPANEMQHSNGKLDFSNRIHNFPI